MRQLNFSETLKYSLYIFYMLNKYYIHVLYKKNKPLFSSPEPKAQMSFSNQNCPLSVVVVVVVNFSNFHLLLQNHWAIFNQTLHKAPLGEGDSSFFFQIKDPALFQGEMISKGENTLTKLKNLFLQNHWANFNQT